MQLLYILTSNSNHIIVTINVLNLNGFLVCAVTPLFSWMLSYNDPSLNELSAIVCLLRDDVRS